MPRLLITLTVILIQILLDLLYHKNDVYIDEMQYYLYETTGLSISKPTICRHLKAMQWLKKKSEFVATQQND